MRRSTRKLKVAWVLALAATPVWGATPATAVQEAAWKTDPGRAPEARAAGFLARDGSWERAATLLVRFADGRAPCDAAAREALLLAARYYGFAGAYGRAGRAAYRSAESGRLTGRVTEAADAFLLAATFALEAHEPLLAVRAARQASLLAESPLLTAAQRIAIRGRADAVLDGREATG